LEKYLAGRYTALELQTKTFLTELDTRAKPWPELDALINKYNVFALIVPRPTATPLPTRTFKNKLSSRSVSMTLQFCSMEIFATTKRITRWGVPVRVFPRQARTEVCADARLVPTRIRGVSGKRMANEMQNAIMSLSMIGTQLMTHS
jgi:hypothetical protein